MAVAGTDGEAWFGVGRELAAGHMIRVARTQKKKPAMAFRHRRTPLNVRQCYRPGMHAVAGVAVETAIADEHIPAHLEAQPLAIVVAFDDAGHFQITTRREVDRAAPAAVHARVPIGCPVPLDDQIADSGAVDAVAEDQREGRGQHRLLVGRIVGLDTMVQPDPAGLNPGDAGKGAVEPPPQPVVDGNRHARLQAGRGGQGHVAHAVVMVAGQRVDTSRGFPQHGLVALPDQFDPGAQLQSAVEVELERGEYETTATLPGHRVDGSLDGRGGRAFGRSQA